MIQVILTSGPRNVGKTTYCKGVIEKYPNISYLSRDEILIELFGSTTLSPYGGGHSYAMNILFERLKEIISTNPNSIIIFDCWNGYLGDRRCIVDMLKDIGVTKVYLWYFYVPVDICYEFAIKKESSVRGYLFNFYLDYLKSCVRYDHSLFYQQPIGDFFDCILHINSLQYSFDFNHHLFANQ